VNNSSNDRVCTRIDQGRAQVSLLFLPAHCIGQRRGDAWGEGGVIVAGGDWMRWSWNNGRREGRPTTTSMQGKSTLLCSFSKKIKTHHLRTLWTRLIQLIPDFRDCLDVQIYTVNALLTHYIESFFSQHAPRCAICAPHTLFIYANLIRSCLDVQICTDK
jgi:hypothetical protein